jgi:hypothetical protein
MAGLKADAWPHQETLAERFAVSSRQVRRWLSELETSGYIRKRRTGQGDHYHPCWADENVQSDRTETSTPIGQKCPIGVLVSINEPGKQPEQQQQRQSEPPKKKPVVVVDVPLECMDVLAEMASLINGM